MSSPKPFNWDNPSANLLPEIRNEAKLLGVNFRKGARKQEMLNELVLAKSRLDQQNTFQRTSATNSPKKITAPPLQQGSKTPIIKTKKAGANQPIHQTYINPRLLANDEKEEPKQSPVVNNFQLPPVPQQEAPKSIPERNSPSPKRDSPSPQRTPTPERQRTPTPERNPTASWSPSPTKQSPTKQSPERQRTPTPERNPSSSWSPSPAKHSPIPQKEVRKSPTPEKKLSPTVPTSSHHHHHSHRKSKKTTPVKYESDDDWTESRFVRSLYRFLPYLLVIFFIISIIINFLAPIFVILLILYIYLRVNYNRKSSKRNILEFE